MTQRHPNSHYQHVAAIWLGAWRKGKPSWPTTAVQQRFGVPYSTAARWVRRAQEGGTPTKRRRTRRTMTVADLLEILNDPDLPPDTPVRVQTSYQPSTWTVSGYKEWMLEGAHGQMAGPGRVLVLELCRAHPTEEGAD